MPDDIDIGVPAFLFGKTIFLVPNEEGSGYHLELWDSEAHEAVPLVGEPGPEQVASLLVRSASGPAVLGDYLATADSVAVLTAAGEPISIGALRVQRLPDFVLSASGDVIAVPGR